MWNRYFLLNVSHLFYYVQIVYTPSTDSSK